MCITFTTPFHSLPNIIICQATGSSTFRRIISSSGAPKTSSRSPKAQSSGSFLHVVNRRWRTGPTMDRPMAISWRGDSVGSGDVPCRSLAPLKCRRTLGMRLASSTYTARRKCWRTALKAGPWLRFWLGDPPVGDSHQQTTQHCNFTYVESIYDFKKTYIWYARCVQTLEMSLITWNHVINTFLLKKMPNLSILPCHSKSTPSGHQSHLGRLQHSGQRAGHDEIGMELDHLRRRLQWWTGLNWFTPSWSIP